MTQVFLDVLIAKAKSGFLVSFPTDTVPALAVRPDQAQLIFAAKKRSLDKPLILMAAATDDLWPYIQGSAAEMQFWQELTHKYWPGALTLVLPASDRLPRAMNPLTPGSIGVRVPKSAIAQQILAATGPLATTSANRSGQPPLLSMAEIAAEFSEVFTLATTESEKINQEVGLPSTVAQWTGKGFVILRPGTVKLESDAEIGAGDD